MSSEACVVWTMDWIATCICDPIGWLFGTNGIPVATLTSSPTCRAVFLCSLIPFFALILLAVSAGCWGKNKEEEEGEKILGGTVVSVSECATGMATAAFVAPAVGSRYEMRIRKRK